MAKMLAASCSEAKFDDDGPTDLCMFTALYCSHGQANILWLAVTAVLKCMMHHDGDVDGCMSSDDLHIHTWHAIRGILPSGQHPRFISFIISHWQQYCSKRQGQLVLDV